MKKILSLALAVMMLVSAVPMVYAADIGFGQSTTITLYGEDAESYSIDVPATLQPGQSGTVSVSGKWGSNKTMTVTCPDTVTLYYGEQSMNVGIEFADIALVGSDTEGVSTTSTVSVNDASALFGTWTGVLNYEIELVEEAQLINFYIDSTAYKAEEGMTWTEWVESEYNTDGYSVGNAGNGSTIIANTGSAVCGEGAGVPVSKGENIIANTHYYISISGAGD